MGRAATAALDKPVEIAAAHRVGVDDIAVGRPFRIVRVRARLRQRDVARKADASQGVVSSIERGRCEDVTLPKIRRVAKALGIRVELDARLPGGEASRLLDIDHARIVETLARELRASGWRVIPEFTFNHYGDRGSVDLLGWHEVTRTLLLVEVKTRLLNVQALLASEDRKHRIVPMLVGRDFGWEVAAVGQLLVVERTTANRHAIERHASTLRAVYPDHARRVRTWLRQPRSVLGALWLRSFITHATPTQLRQRVRSPERA